MANPVGGAAAGAAGGALGGPVGSLIGAGVGLLGSIFSSKSQSSAQNKATTTQADYNNRALAAAQDEQKFQREQIAAQQKRADDETAYRRNRYADYLTQLEPYAAAGRQAIGRVASTNAAALPAAAGALGSGALVTLADAQGRTRQVPASQVEHYVQQGAQVVR